MHYVTHVCVCDGITTSGTQPGKKYAALEGAHLYDTGTLLLCLAYEILSPTYEIGTDLMS